MLKAKNLEALPGIRHAFFTRAGGVSTGVYEGLNGGTGSNDKPEHVAENRARMAREYIAPRPIDMEWATAFVHILRDGDARHVIPDAIAEGAKWRDLQNLVATSNPSRQKMRKLFEAKDEEDGRSEVR